MQLCITIMCIDLIKIDLFHCRGQYTRNTYMLVLYYDYSIIIERIDSMTLVSAFGEWKGFAAICLYCILANVTRDHEVRLLTQIL